jgi:hypothetical protein
MLFPNHVLLRGDVPLVGTPSSLERRGKIASAQGFRGLAWTIKRRAPAM